ncbi:MAG: PilW family protein [Burkholderiaceae bacterium]|jgi:type IV pilus assembly protein PilW|nr:PilW family protein [Burkholderiaceae bacterium]
MKPILALRARLPAPRRSQAGLTLVETMIAMAIGLVIVAALSAVFVGSSHSRREVQSSADTIETGRYAADLLARELSAAGFLGTLVKPVGTTVAICSTAVADWSDSLAVHAVGLNNGEADPACFARKPGTDAIFVQRASTCTAGSPGCEAESAANAYLQVSECGSEYGVTPSVLAVGGDSSSFTLKTKDCAAATAAKRKLIRRAYFVSAADVLSYVDLGLAGPSAAVPLVEDVEQLQFSYAFDADGDGTAECFASTLAGCVGAEWPQVVGVRVWVLSRSESTSRNAAAAMQFVMDDTTIDVPASASGNLKRRVYTTYVPFVTPKSRREH